MCDVIRNNGRLVLLCVYIVPYGNYGCSGGNMYNSFMYVIANDGVDTEDSYAYVGRVSSYIHTYIHT